VWLSLRVCVCVLAPRLTLERGGCLASNVCVQVSAYGDDRSSDGGDVWILDWDTKGKIWKQDTKVDSLASIEWLVRGISFTLCFLRLRPRSHPHSSHRSASNIRTLAVGSPRWTMRDLGSPSQASRR
jgi:hypothetical protein